MPETSVRAASTSSSSYEQHVVTQAPVDEAFCEGDQRRTLASRESAGAEDLRTRCEKLGGRRAASSKLCSKRDRIVRVALTESCWPATWKTGVPGIELREIFDPRARMEVRMRVDQACENRIGVSEELASLGIRDCGLLTTCDTTTGAAVGGNGCGRRHRLLRPGADDSNTLAVCFVHELTFFLFASSGSRRRAGKSPGHHAATDHQVAVRHVGTPGGRSNTRPSLAE